MEKCLNSLLREAAAGFVFCAVLGDTLGGPLANSAMPLKTTVEFIQFLAGKLEGETCCFSLFYQGKRSAMANLVEYFIGFCLMSF